MKLAHKYFTLRARLHVHNAEHGDNTNWQVAMMTEIEELLALGKREGSCPYYATRAALPEAQLVLLPYAALLHEVHDHVIM